MILCVLLNRIKRDNSSNDLSALDFSAFLIFTVLLTCPQNTSIIRLRNQISVDSSLWRWSTTMQCLCPSSFLDRHTAFFQIFLSLAIVVQCGNVITIQSATWSSQCPVSWAYLVFFCGLTCFHKYVQLLCAPYLDSPEAQLLWSWPLQSRLHLSCTATAYDVTSCHVTGLPCDVATAWSIQSNRDRRPMTAAPTTLNWLSLLNKRPRSPDVPAAPRRHEPRHVTFTVRVCTFVLSTNKNSRLVSQTG